MGATGVAAGCDLLCITLDDSLLQVSNKTVILLSPFFLGIPEFKANHPRSQFSATV
jgi:hypothetical protein